MNKVRKETKTETKKGHFKMQCIHRNICVVKPQDSEIICHHKGSWLLPGDGGGG